MNDINARKILPVSVAIPTINRPESLKHTLDSYMSMKALPCEIIVVDQSASAEIRNEIESAVKALPENVKGVYIYQTKPSITDSRNRAFEAASNDILIYSDDDVEPEQEALENLYNLFQDETGGKTALVASYGTGGAGPSALKKMLGFITGARSWKNRNIGNVTMSMLGRYPAAIKTETATQWAMGYFFSVRRTLAEKWNIKSDSAMSGYAYAEDLDYTWRYCLKARGEGMKCIISPSVRVKHLVSREYRIPSKKHTWLYIVNRHYLLYKHKRPFPARLVLEWCNICRLLERVLKREKPVDFAAALWYSWTHSAEIRQGKLDCGGLI
ncbi:MAG: glycosyltransferase [Elusimicrobiales bacterium]|nr:glycosyltransferase [Elusimicrobiales bacterium]